jgi:hypothetical protein
MMLDDGPIAIAHEQVVYWRTFLTLQEAKEAIGFTASGGWNDVERWLADWLESKDHGDRAREGLARAAGRASVKRPAELVEA